MSSAIWPDFVVIPMEAGLEVHAIKGVPRPLAGQDLSLHVVLVLLQPDLSSPNREACLSLYMSTSYSRLANSPFPGHRAIRKTDRPTDIPTLCYDIRARWTDWNIGDRLHLAKFCLQHKNGCFKIS
ncbi:hypothetical protein GHT09_003280 [Marmota monax]|uniref:Uncharacterized protein n=1 Tax=Marmota monax TaxID=9995 RepID=A0A834UPU7_MARMO|nr:hypothetical protein GHT09_003280 [Marmota monax]